MDMTNDEIITAFKRQVNLCAGIGRKAMINPINEKFPEPKDQWIPVSTPPENKDNVIMCSTECRWTKIGYFDSMNWYEHDDNDGFVPEHPTHWQPLLALPEPPQQ